MLQTFRQLNLTPKLTLIFVLFAAVLLAGVGVFAYFSGRLALQAATISNLLSIANEKGEELDSWVVDKQTDLIQLAHSPALINQVTILRATSPDSAAAREAHTHLLAELKPGTSLGPHVFSELFIIEPDRGQIIASTNPVDEGKFKENRPYFINGKDGPYVQPPYYSLVRQGPAMTAAVPVRSAKGKLLGVLAGRLDLAELNTIVQRSAHLHQTLDVFLVNTSNLFVTQPRYVSGPAILQRQITRPEINRCLQGENGTVLADDYRGVPAVIVYRWLPDHQLCLKAKLDQAEVFAPITAFGNRLWLISLLGLLAASLVAMGLARAITRPVQTLQQGAIRFGRGELDARLPETTGDELGRLAREFNQMAAALAEKEAQLRAHAGQLELKVAERTAALQASEAELRAVFAAMPDVIFVLDREGRYLKVAPTDPSLLYKLPVELVGKTVYDIFPEEQAAAFVDQVHLALEREQPVNYEYGLQIDNQELWFAATVSPMTSDSVVWVARDITERKEAEHVIAQRASQLVVINDLGRQITAVLELDNLLNTAAYLIQQTFDYHHVALFLVTGDRLNLKAVAGWYEPYFPSDHVQQISEGINGWVASHGEKIVANDVEAEPRYTSLIAEHTITQAELCLPIKIGDQTVGVLDIQSPNRNAFSENDMVAMEAIAGQIAVAIENARLYERAQQEIESRRRAEKKTQHHLQRLTALRNIDLAITSNLHSQAVLNVLLEQITSQLKVDAATVLLLDSKGQHLEYAAGRGLRAASLTQLRLPLDKSYAGRVALEQQIIIVPNLPQDAEAPARAQLLLEEGFITYYGVPLVVKGHVEGVLEIFHRAPLESDPEWLEFLKALSAQAAIAIENARLFEETQEQAQQLEQILDSVPEGVLLLDANQRLILANPIAQNYLNILTPQEVGDRLTQLDGRSLEELLQPAANGLWHELEVSGPPYRIFEIEVRSLNFEPQAGGWVLVIREATREREVQQRIQQQERLAAVGQLAAGIAHDFNNILTGIIGFAELARFQPNAVDSTEETLDRIIEQGNRAARLIRQILDFSRQTIAERQKMDLLPLIKENMKFLRRIISEDIQISLETEPGHEAFSINANPVQIQQVLTNLALNAQDAMPSGGVLKFQLTRLVLELDQPAPCPELSPGEWIVLSVSDTGIGISAQNLPHLFEPFFTTKTVDKGTGLGLAQVYGIVKQHNGEINVISQDGQGTTFTIYLPAVASALSSERSIQLATEEMPRGQGELILLVEDDSGVRWVAAAMLEVLGYQVLIANNGRQALEIYHEHQDDIALVLTDVRMPETGGIALSQALQKINPALKVIAMTGYPLEDKANEVLAQNFVKWLQKPLDTVSLAQTISQVLKKKSQ